MNSVIVLLIKNKNGNTADMNNYRVIALSNMLTKIFESVIIDAVEMQDDADIYQFGFKHGHSTTLCIKVLSVNYWRLFNYIS